MDKAQEGAHRNTISGQARLDGPTVQGRDVYGGIHVHAAAAAAPPPSPRQLLPVTANFTGRSEDLAALDGLFAGDGPDGPPRTLLVVSGQAGIGKTTLVSRWLRSLGSEFPDGQLYADLRGHSTRGPASPGEVLSQFLRALGAGAVPVDPAEQASLWRSFTMRRADRGDAGQRFHRGAGPPAVARRSGWSHDRDQPPQADRTPYGRSGVPQTGGTGARRRGRVAQTCDRRGPRGERAARGTPGGGAVRRTRHSRSVSRPRDWHRDPDSP